MTAKQLIEIFEQMYAEHWAYEWGGASEGVVDCSGAFVYAYKQLGAPALEHSSNYMARRAIAGSLLPMSRAKAGYAAFKRRDQREDTPERWKDGKGDYYHVGLVGYDGRILNAAGTAYGFQNSDPASWDCCAPLKAVDYEDDKEGEGMAVLYRASVSTQSGALNIRASFPFGAVLCKAPKGATVDVLAEYGEWLRVRYDGAVGYASAQYLTRMDDMPENGAESACDAPENADEGFTEIVRADGLRLKLGGIWTFAGD